VIVAVVALACFLLGLIYLVAAATVSLGPPAEVEVDPDGDRLVVTIRGFDKVWALRSRLSIPLSAVREVTTDPAAMPGKGRVRGRGLRLGGTSIPPFVTAGRFWTPGNWQFWTVHRRPNLFIALDRSVAKSVRFDALVLEVDDPEAVAAAIRAALAAHR
jgi:hypothetical protein